jgi:hypothetical protein
MRHDAERFQQRLGSLTSTIQRRQRSPRRRLAIVDPDYYANVEIKVDEIEAKLEEGSAGPFPSEARQIRNSDRIRHYLARGVDMQAETNRLLAGIRSALWLIAFLLIVGLYAFRDRYHL